jgi:hypothetical protein
MEMQISNGAGDAESQSPQSLYWLSPGVDVPVLEDEAEDPRTYETIYGFMVDVGAGEAVFSPQGEFKFMDQSPIWRMDVASDLLASIIQVYEHAAVEYLRELQSQKKADDASMDASVDRYKELLKEAGLPFSDSLERKIRSDQRYIEDALKGALRNDNT